MDFMASEGAMRKSQVTEAASYLIRMGASRWFEHSIPQFKSIHPTSLYFLTMCSQSSLVARRKTAVVLGLAYGGAKAAKVLAAGLPADWRLIAIDRNSHMNHVYVMPRFAVLPGHEYKAFIPNTNVFGEGDTRKPNHITLKTTVTSIQPTHITVSDAFPELGIHSKEIAFDYAIYALGANLPAPLDLWGKDPREAVKPGDEKVWTYNGTKSDGIAWLQERQKAIEAAPTVLVVGGGALGIQFATDIKAIYPEKEVTLLHSRKQLLPRFDREMHDEIRKTMELQEIDLILGERLDLSTVDEEKKVVNAQGQRVVRTEKGREIAADLLLLCTGQRANTKMLEEMDAATINPENGRAFIQRTMQLTTSPPIDSLTTTFDKSVSVSNGAPGDSGNGSSTYTNIFVAGDAADAFGAIQAGHTAWGQAIVAANNVVTLVTKPGEELEEYTSGIPSIKVSLGITKSVYHSRGTFGIKDDGVADLRAASMWGVYEAKAESDEDLRL
ncbi:hypothetical protein D9611_009916 [Ephemerocybe angulata]|uniref:FAD/NAD(P)-binding domain-containing protein n=1 Tax=Ephemerocybe angulata TaxID=980116 RepID=A0A8H5FJQ3_9AGAR|nr:hypothetical protein D9611_009916 [Tulosesus angulatus]